MKKNTKTSLLKPTSVLVVSIVLILIAIAAPFAITRDSILGIKFNFENTGAIGDTIGGITAPIIGILGAFLIYHSFKAQITANKLLRKEQSTNYLFRIFDDISKEFENIENEDSSKLGWVDHFEQRMYQWKDIDKTIRPDHSIKIETYNEKLGQPIIKLEQNFNNIQLLNRALIQYRNTFEGKTNLLELNFLSNRLIGLLSRFKYDKFSKDNFEKKLSKYPFDDKNEKKIQDFISIYSEVEKFSNQLK